MSGILRLANDASGQSTLDTNATTDVTYSLPNTGADGTAIILTDDAHEVTSINWDGIDVTIENGDINLDNGTLFIDESTNRVGIGTTSPSKKLTVVNDVAEGTAIQFTDGVNATGRLGTPTNGVVAFGGNENHSIVFGGWQNSGDSITQERARFDTDGKLLVGTQSSSDNSLIQIQGRSNLATGPAEFALRKGDLPNSGDNIAVIKFQDNNSNAGAFINTAADGANWISGSSHPTRLEFATAAAGSSVPAEHLRIDSDGQLLASNYKSNGVLDIAYDANGNNGNNDFIRFVQGQITERARIDHNGISFQGNTNIDRCLGYYQYSQYLGRGQFFAEDNTDANNTETLFSQTFNSQGYFLIIGNLCRVTYRIQGTFNSPFSNFANTSRDDWFLRFRLPFVASTKGSDNAALLRNLPFGSFDCTQITSDPGTSFSMSYTLINAGGGTDYANIRRFPTWGTLRNELGPSANYQFFVQGEYLIDYSVLNS